jgi:hypothetical protein
MNVLAQLERIMQYLFIYDYAFNSDWAYTTLDDGAITRLEIFAWKQPHRIQSK